MPQLPQLDPIVDPATGLMTTAVPAGAVPGLKKVAPAPSVPPQQPEQEIRPEILQLGEETTGQAQPGIRPEILQLGEDVLPSASAPPPGIRPEIFSLGEGVAPTGITAPVTPQPPSPELDTKDWRDALLSSQALDVLPFIGGMSDAWSAIKILRVAGKAERGEASPEEESELNNFLIDSQRPQTFGYSFVQGLLQLPGFALELGLTAGVYTAGKAVTTQALKRGLLKYATSRAGKAAIAATSRVAGVAAQTAAARGPAIITGTAERMLPTIQLDPVETEKLNFIIQHDEAGIVKSFAKSFASQMIEVGTERAGGLIDRLPATQVFQGALKRYLRIHPTAGVAKFMDMTRNKLLRNSFIAEFFEEEIAKPLHILLGTETGYRGKESTLAKRAGEQYNFRNYLLQTAILAVPTAGGAVLQKMTTPSKAQLAKMDVEERAKSVAQYKTDLHDNLVNIGIPVEVVDQSGVIDKMAVATDAAEREQVLNDFAEQNLAGEVAPAPEVPTAPLAEQPTMAPPIPVGGEITPLLGQPAAKPAEPTELPPITEIKPTKPPTITPAVAEPTITAKPIPEAWVEAVKPVGVFDERFKNALMGESMGGNAGANRSAVNYLHDGKKVVFWGNFQNAPDDIKAAFKSGELQNGIIHVEWGEGGKTVKVVGLRGDDMPGMEEYIGKDIDTAISVPPAVAGEAIAPKPIPKVEAKPIEAPAVAKPAEAPAAKPTKPISPPPAPKQQKSGVKLETTKPEATAGALTTEGKPDIQQGGTETRVSGTRGESFPAKYAVVPREALIASHDPATFAKNPLYPLINPRDYASEGEQAKVLTIKKEFEPDQHVTDAASAAVGPVMAAHVIDEQGNRQLVVLGGNTREMVTQAMTPTQKKALADFTNKRAERFGIKTLPDANHELIRYMGEFDLNKKGVREKLQSVVDSLNPSPGKVQNIMEMATVDASTSIKPENLTGLTADITPEDAQAKVEQFIADKVIDRGTRSMIAEHPAQAQEYLRRVLVNVAFRNPVLAEFATTTDRKKAAGRGLVESAAPTTVELRGKAQDKIADAIGRTMAEVAGYMNKGDSLQVALKKASQQTDFDKRYAIVLDIAAAMHDRIVLNKKGRGINTEETIDNFASFWDRVGLAVKQWEAAPDMFEQRNIDDVIRSVMDVIKAEQEQIRSIPSKNIVIAKTRRESRRRVGTIDRTMALPGLEVPFNLRGDLAPTATPAVAEEKAGEPTQPELFAIQKVTQLIDPVKSADMAEELYGSPDRALKMLKNQLSIINTDPAQKKFYPKEARERLSEVFNLLEQRIQARKRASMTAPGQVLQTVKASSAQSVVNQFTKGWKNKPKGGIRVVQSESDADEMDLSDESMQAIGDFKAEGFYHIPTDTVVIIADNLERTSDVIRVALHESIVHSGLSRMLGDKFNAELERIGNDIPENELTEIALRYELDLSNKEEHLEAIEEYLGKYAPTRNPTLFQRFLAAIRRALRAMGINEHLVDAFDKRGDIEQLVDSGREFIESGRRIEPLPRREGVRRALTPRVPEGTAKKDIDKSLFLKRAVLSNDLTPEVRSELKKYVDQKIQHNPETKAEVEKIVAANGPNESEQMFFRDDKKIIPAARIPLGAALSHMHLEAARKATNKATKDGHMEAAIDIMKKMADMGQESGQVSQSFTMYHSGEMMETPGGAEMMLNRLVRDTVKKTVEQLPVTISEVKQATEKAKTEDVNEALINKQVQKGIAKILHRLGSTARNGLPARLRNADNQAKWKAFQAKNKEVLSKVVKFAAPELTLEEKIEVATAFGANILFDSKTLNYGDWSAKMKARFGEGITPVLERVWDESAILADNTMRGKVSVLAPVGTKAEQKAKKQKRQVATMTTEANRIVREWMLESESKQIGQPTERKFEDAAQPTLPTQKTIINSLADLGMTEREGFKFITDVQREAGKRAQAKKEKRLQQLLKGKQLSPTNQSAIDRILEISSIRRLDNAEIMDIFAEKMGLPKMTPELAGQLEDLAEKIRKAPSGYPKIQAGRVMMAFMKKKMPLNKTEVMWSMWYANILSGYQTQERNIISTFNNVMANLVTSMMVDPKNSPFAIAGLVSGIKRGWREARFTMATGETPVHITPEHKLEVPNTLELSPFKGFLKVFNNWKYVMRAMIAEDMIMFKPSQESRAMMIAADLAREEGLSGTKLWGRVAEIMGTTNEADFEKQAMAEGFTGLRLRHRIDELMERSRPAEIQTESTEYAKRATFNYQPEGLGGWLGEKVREFQTRAPSPAARVLARFIVPFTRIVANVMNTSVDYSPWGFVRVQRGIRQAGGETRQIVGHERAQRNAKAFLGTAAMITAYALDVMNDDDEEKKKWFAIYAAGTGSSAKNNQLRELGWKPWSVKIGKHYWDYRLTPLAIPFGIIGSIRDAQRWRKLDEKSVAAWAAFSILRSLSVIQDMSFLSGMNQFMNMINVDSPEKAERNARTFFVRSTAGAIIPNIFKQLDRTFDPYLRDNATVIEALMRETPIASRGVNPRLNVLGEPVPQTTGPLSLVVSPAKDSPMWRLIVKNEAWISVPTKTQYLGKRIMTEDEFYKFIKYRGEKLRTRIESRMTYLERLDKEKFNDRIDEYTRDATKQAKNRIRREERESK